LIDKEVIKEYEIINTEKGCYLNDDILFDYFNDNIISHEIISSIFKVHNNKLINCITIKPFQIYDDYNYIEKDDINLLGDFIQSINLNIPTIVSNSEFKIISTYGYVENDCYLNKNNKKIYLPFSVEESQYIKDFILKEKCNEFNENEFIKKTLNSEYYKNIISYIVKINNIDEKSVENEYARLLNKYIELMIKKIEYRKYILFNIKKGKAVSLESITEDLI
jgi:hypothetical protein